ncbi:MAG: 16S rRNA (cytidine(1402)-2'-O)-methyltransferase [Rhodobacterales bacterium]|nr:MAG: 16S rRNA (cytidine(1402)-2'-O)-methyltransferase [Rhodobacterales bacterium]
MNISETKLEAGLYLVATPIGNARDITLRALDILASVDVIAAEDTRTARKLCDLHGVKIGNRPLIAYHDHSGEKGRAGLLKLLGEGKSLAYVSEAGTPLVSDPGYALAREAGAAGYLVTSAPGPSAALAALSLSGLPSDRFLFAGFAPSGASARRKWLTDLLQCPATLIVYESPKRLVALLDDLAEIGGETRRAAICRELTKKFEEVRRGEVGDLRRGLEEDPVRGEVVLLVEYQKPEMTPEEVDQAIENALKTMRVKDAAKAVSEAIGLPKREIYQRALQLSGR